MTDGGMGEQNIAEGGASDTGGKRPPAGRRPAWSAWKPWTCASIRYLGPLPVSPPS